MSDQMLTNLFNRIAEAATKNAGLEIKTIPGDPTKVLLVQDGSRELFSIPRPFRRHEVFNLESLFEAVSKWGSSAVVFHQPGKITAVLDDDDGIGTVEMRLVTTRPFETLKSLEAKPQLLGQAAIIQLLRTDLRNVFSPELIEALRKVGATTSGSTTGEVNYGRERGSSEFAAEIARDSRLNEFDEPRGVVDVYFNLDLPNPYPMTCVLTPMLTSSPMQFSIHPVPQECQRAVEQAHSQLHGLLTEGLGDGVPVIYGSVGEKSLR